MSEDKDMSAQRMFCSTAGELAVRTLIAVGGSEILCNVIAPALGARRISDAAIVLGGALGAALFTGGNALLHLRR